jgi:hypothetical protein
VGGVRAKQVERVWSVWSKLKVERASIKCDVWGAGVTAGVCIVLDGEYG